MLVTGKNREILKHISLFSGGGGLDIGLENAGFTTVYATDIQDYATSTLIANRELRSLTSEDFDAWFFKQINQRCYKNISQDEEHQMRDKLFSAVTQKKYFESAIIHTGDIREVTAEDILSSTKSRIGDIFLVSGGPPCQPFSRAGKREALNVDEGRLFLDFSKIIDEIRPRWFLFENVKGLILTKTDVSKLTCSDCHHSEILRLNSIKDDVLSCPKCSSINIEIQDSFQAGGSLDIILAEFESMGYKCYWNVLNSADFGAAQYRERLFIVGSRDKEDFDWPSETHESFDSSIPQLFKDNKIPHKSMLDVLWPDGHWKYGKVDSSSAVLWVKNVVRPHDEPVTWSLLRPSPTIGAHQAAKLAFAPHGVPQQQLDRQQWHTLGNRQGDTPPVQVEHAYLTDSELGALQTFPDSWFFYGTRMQRAFQIGNAVPPCMSEAIGKQIIISSKVSQKDQK